MTIRANILNTAKETVVVEREIEYGPPWENLTNCAMLWSAYLCAKFAGKTVDPLQITLEAEDVAHLNILQKMARTMTGQKKFDTYVDMAGYSALAGECAQEDESE